MSTIVAATDGFRSNVAIPSISITAQVAMRLYENESLDFQSMSERSLVTQVTAYCLKHGFILIISLAIIISLMPTSSVFADEISNSSVNVPNIWQCIGCSAYGGIGRQMTLDEQQANLNDLWGKEILRLGKFPLKVEDAQKAIAESNSNLTQNIYLVAEGGQIPTSLIAPKDKNRNPRLTITWMDRTIRNQPVLSTLLSAKPGSQTNFFQVIAWDSKKKKFNYYELNRDRNWSWAGDSGHARQPQFLGKGCFACHHNGSVIMKELKRPWNNWTSELATINLSFLPQTIAGDRNLMNLRGSQGLENDIKDGVSQYYNAWFDSHVSEDVTTITEVSELLRHLTTNTSVNFESSSRPSNTVTVVTPPKNFFLFDDILSEVTGDDFDPGYGFPNNIGFDTNKFTQAIGNKGFALRQCSRSDNTNKCQPETLEYEQKGTTFNPFFIPVPSNEDTLVIKMLRRFQLNRGGQRQNIHLITDKFAAAVLMVDFQNPVFSPVRSSLQAYADKLSTATLNNQGFSNIPSLFAAQVESVAARQPPCSVLNLDSCSAEQQFINTWNLSDATWKAQVNQRIQSYLDVVANQIANGSGLSDYVDLSISRKEQFASENPIKNLFESSLLLPQSDVSANTPLRRMQTDGKVASVNHFIDEK